MESGVSSPSGPLSWRLVWRRGGLFTWQGWWVCQAWFVLAAPTTDSVPVAIVALASGGCTNAIAIAAMRHDARIQSSLKSLFALAAVAAVSALAAAAGAAMVGRLYSSDVASIAIWFDYFIGVVGINAFVGAMRAVLDQVRHQAQGAQDRAAALACSRTEAERTRQATVHQVASSLDTQVLQPMRVLLEEASRGSSADLEWRNRWSSVVAGPIAQCLREQAHVLAQAHSPSAAPTGKTRAAPLAALAPLDPDRVPMPWLAVAAAPVVASVTLSESPRSLPGLLLGVVSFALVVWVGFWALRRLRLARISARWVSLVTITASGAGAAVIAWGSFRWGADPKWSVATVDALSMVLAVAGGAILAAHHVRWRDTRRAAEGTRDCVASALMAERAAADRAWTEAAGVLHSIAQTRAYAIAGGLASPPSASGDLALVATRSLVDEVLPYVYSLLTRHTTDVSVPAYALGTSGLRGLGVELDVAVRGTLSSEERAVVQQVVAEAVMNAVKHGRATKVACHIRASRHKVRIIVEDNGSGPAADWAPGLGLGSLARRATRWRLIRGAGGGARLIAVLPRLAGGIVAALLALMLAVSFLGTPSVSAASPIVEISAPGGILRLDVALSASEQNQGLLDWKSLPPGRGMLFVVDRERHMSLWMLDMRFPVDIVFIRDGRVTQVVRHARPCRDLPCRVYHSRGPVDAVIEIGAGQARLLGLRVGVVLAEEGGLLS